MLNKNIKEKIFLKINDNKIYIYFQEDNIYLKIISNNNKDFIYYDKFSFEFLKNNKIFENCKNIQEIYDFLNKVTKDYSKKNNLIIEEHQTCFLFMIKLKDEDIITFKINKEDDEEENDSIFKNNLNNFENILNEIENDMNNLDPYIKELKDENKKITEENIKLNKEIEVLKEENKKLKQELNNKINSNDNPNSTNSKNENSKKEIIKNENEIKVKKNNENEIKAKTITQKSKQEITNSDLNKKKSNDNLIYKNNNYQEKKKLDNENKISKDENKKIKKEFKKSESIGVKENIFSKELINRLTIYIKESETYKNSNISFKLLYKALIDKDSASSFHNKVDNKGPILVIIKTKDNRIIGGFSSKSWSSEDKYIEDNEAFLFNEFYKFNLNSKNNEYACFHNKEEGPHFGKNALIVSNNCLKDYSKNICRKDDTYQFKMYNLIGKTGESNLKIKDYEVYHVIFK